MRLTEQQKSEDWRIVKFGDVAQECKEKVDRENNPFERYVAGGNMDSESLRIRRWSVFGEDYVGPAFHRVFRKGQVLYGSRRTYLKKVAVANFDGVTANTTFVIETKPNSPMLPGLLPFLMLSDSFTNHSVSNSKGSTNPYIAWSDIAKFKFPLPPHERQEEILEVISKIYNLSNKTYDVYLASLSFFQRLIDNIVNSDRQDQPRENWKRVMIKNLADANVSSLKRKTDPNYTFNYIDISSVEYPGISLPTEQLLFKNAPSRAKRIVKQNDVIVSTVRPNHRATLLIDEIRGVDHVASTGFSVLSPKLRISGEWLFYCTISKSFTHSMKNLMVGTSFPAISDDDILVQKADYPENPETLEKFILPIRKAHEISKQLVEKYNNLKILQKQTFQTYLQSNKETA